MSTQFNVSDVFISYSRKDTDFVKGLDKAFKAQNREVWVDWEDIPLTADWWEEIKAGIDAANAFVFIISPDSVQSPICRDEVEHAVQAGKRIVPVLHREVVEQAHKEQMHPSLSSHNWVLFNKEPDFDTAFGKLVSAIDMDLDHVRAHARYTIRATEWQADGGSSHLLLTGRDARAARNWLEAAKTKNEKPTNLQESYIKASVRATRNRRLIISTGLLVGLIITFLMFVAFGLQQEADEQREIAVTQEAVAIEQREIAVTQEAVAIEQRTLAEREAAVSDSLRISTNARLALTDNRTALAVALGLEAVKINNPPEATVQTLMEAGFVPGLRNVHTHDSIAWALDVSPDNTQVIVGLGDGRILIRDIATGEVIQTLEGHELTVTSVLPVPDSNWLLSASADQTIRLWNVQTREEIRRFEGHTAALWDLVLFPDNRRLASVDAGGTTFVWDIETGDVLQQFQDHEAAVWSVDVSVSGNLLATGDLSGRIVIRDTTTWGDPVTIEAGDAVLDIEFIQDLAVVTGEGVGTITLWDPTNGQILDFYTEHLSAVNALDFDNENFLLASGDDNGTIYVREITPSEDRLLHRFDTHNSYVGKVHLVPALDLVMSVDGSGELHEIELKSALETGRFGPSVAAVTGALFAPNGEHAYFSDYRGGIAEVDVISNTFIDGIPQDEAIFINLTVDGSRMMALLLGEIVIYDTATMAEVNRFPFPSELNVATTAFSPDGTYIATGDTDGLVVIVDAASGEAILSGEVHTNGVNAVLFSPSGDSLYTAGQDSTVIRWDITTGAATQEYQFQTPVNALALNADGSLLAAATQDGTVTLWDTETVTQLDTLIRTSSSLVFVEFVAGDTEIVTGTLAGFIRVWSVETGAQLLSVDTRNVLRIMDVTSDGTRAIIASDSGFVQVFDLTLRDLDEVVQWVNANRHVREFTCEERAYYQLDPLCDA